MHSGLNVGQPRPDDARAGDQHHVPAGLDPLVSHGLAQKPLGSIANNRAADAATCHYSAAALGRVFQSLRRDDNNKRVGVRSSFTPHPLNIG